VSAQPFNDASENTQSIQSHKRIFEEMNSVTSDILNQSKSI
jgi:hypothetical protein